MFFGAETIKAMESDLELVRTSANELSVAFVRHEFGNDLAREYAHHGFARRIITMARCVERVFELLPPTSDAVPTAQTRKDAEINLQAFVFNLFAATDNLAWVWVNEKPIKRENGSDLPKEWIGLRAKNTYVRGTFSKGFQATLQEFGQWFEHLENYRHASAHRISLYIPPFGVSQNNQAEYEELQKLQAEALGKGDVDAYLKHSEALAALQRFQPVMKHSWSEGSPTVVFHAQMIADFKTIVALAEGIIGELKKD